MRGKALVRYIGIVNEKERKGDANSRADFTALTDSARQDLLGWSVGQRRSRNVAPPVISVS